MNKELPIFKLAINDNSETGLDAVSLVESPAVKYNFLKFSEDKPVNLQFKDPEKRMVTGVAMLADTPIYRNNRLGEHYIVFEKDVIEQMVIKFFKNDKTNNTNLDHNKNLDNTGATLVESYFINKDRNILPAEFKDVPDGSWMTTYKIENDEVWQSVINNEFKGFSIEGDFIYEDIVNKNEMKSEDEPINSILEFLNKINK